MQPRAFPIANRRVARTGIEVPRMGRPTLDGAPTRLGKLGSSAHVELVARIQAEQRRDVTMADLHLLIVLHPFLDLPMGADPGGRKAARERGGAFGEIGVIAEHAGYVHAAIEEEP